MDDHYVPVPVVRAAAYAISLHVAAVYVIASISNNQSTKMTSHQVESDL